MVYFYFRRASTIYLYVERKAILAQKGKEVTR